MARRLLPPSTPFPTVEASWPDPDWSPNCPDWIKANVWSAQYTALKVNQQEPRELSLEGSRCAACASPGGNLCSRCMQVCFCNRACQRAAWPVHKHYCQPVEEQSANFDLKPVQALRIAFEMEAPAEGDGRTADLRRLYDISRSTDPAVQSSLPCGQACLWIGLCWACMNHVPQGWSFLR